MEKIPSKFIVIYTGQWSSLLALLHYKAASSCRIRCCSPAWKTDSAPRTRVNAVAPLMRTKREMMRHVCAVVRRNAMVRMTTMDYARGLQKTQAPAELKCSYSVNLSGGVYRSRYSWYSHQPVIETPKIKTSLKCLLLDREAHSSV